MNTYQARKRKYDHEDTDTLNTQSILDQQVIIVQQNNNQLLQTILNNQLQLQLQLTNFQDNQNKKLKHLNNQIHNLQINISNFETVIPNIVKEKLKDSVGEILFIIQDTYNQTTNQTTNQTNNYHQVDNNSQINYVL